MDDFYSKVRIQFERQLPFVIYCKPGSNVLMGFLQRNDSLFHAVDFSEKGFVFCSFDRKKNILIPTNESEIIKGQFTPIQNEDYNIGEQPLDEIAKEKFISLVTKAVQAVNEKILSKVVLSREEVVQIENFDAVLTFKRLVNAYPAAFRYCFFHPKIGMWLGATPEQLLNVVDRKFSTIALAGTQQFNAIQKVVWGDKEKEEQQIVTEFILENLDGLTSDIAISNPYTYRAGNLVHIKTDIEGSLETGSSTKNVLDILHPTPAVCGFPKEAAAEFISKNEGYDRSFYTGFLGELNLKSKTDLFVNLRCMEINGNHAHLYMGCGITKDSDPEKEFDETVNKSMTMKRILN